MSNLRRFRMKGRARDLRRCGTASFETGRIYSYAPFFCICRPFFIRIGLRLIASQTVVYEGDEEDHRLS